MRCWTVTGVRTCALPISGASGRSCRVLKPPRKLPKLPPLKMVILSHPTGNANLRETARAFNESGLLSELWTSVHWRPDHPLNTILPQSVQRQMNRRHFPYVERKQVRGNPMLESGRLLADRLGFSPLTR